MTTIEKAVQIILKERFKIKQEEKILIITDENKKPIADIFLKQASKIAHSDLIDIPVGKVHGEEPPKETAEKMLDYDIIFMITEKSLSHTIARKNATEAGARIASMPGITAEILERAIDVNYKKMKKIEIPLKETINNGNNIIIRTEKGTMLSFSIKNRQAHGGTYGECDQKGAWLNFPTGEVYIAPIEGTAEGVFIVDGSMGGTGKIKTPIRIVVEKGYAVNIIGGMEAEKVEHIISKCGKEAYQVAEFGIGTNPGAKLSGVVLEDEKVIGTCHIALGSNFSFGGNIKVNCHIDGIIKNPTITIDDKKIMKNGKFLI